MDVLIIAPENDVHALCVRNAVEARFGRSAAIWDSSTLPSHSRLTFDPDGAVYLHRGDDLPALDLREVGVIWWRRPGRAEIPPEVTDPEVQRYCADETARLLRGVAYARAFRVVNDLHAQTRAESKPLQLQRARELGLRIPDTQITNDPQILSGRVLDASPWVVKALRSPDWKFAETRLLDEAHLYHLDHMRYSPVIVQRAILGGRDIRVTVVGDQIFCAGPDPRTRIDHVDCRLDFTSAWIETTIPDHISEKLVRYVADLRLHYGAIDLKEDSDGTIYFLEINPSGQFLFAEVDSGVPIVATFAAMLCDVAAGKWSK